MKVASSILCNAAMELMSPFIDSMVPSEDAESLRSHVADCVSCRRQLQSLISLRTLMAGSEPVSVPEDLHLETRVRLSHERARNRRQLWQTRVDNVLRPLLMPAVFGVVVTLLGFGVLFVSLASVGASGLSGPSGPSGIDDLRNVATVYQQPQTTDSTQRWLSAVPSAELDQTLSLQAEVNRDGRIDGVLVLAGDGSPGVEQRLQEMVLLSRLKPATLWGLPVRSRVIFSFVTVRG